MTALTNSLSKDLPGGFRISTHRVDMASPEEIKRLFEEVEKEHNAPVDILIPNAGYGKRIINIEYVCSIQRFLRREKVNMAMVCTQVRYTSHI
jgi:short-subunit dehydrogenase